MRRRSTPSTAATPSSSTRAILDLVTGDPATTAEILPLLQLLASPASGILFSMAGPFLAPIGALLDSITRIIENVGQGEVIHALEDLIKLPLNMIGSVFTGSDINLDFLIPMLAGSLPAGVELNGLDFALPGLFSTGAVAGGAAPAAGEPSVYTDINGGSVTPVGGSLLNAIGVHVDLNGTPFDIDSHPVGPIGALIGLSQSVGAALGMGWDGKDAVAKAPLLGLDPFDVSGLFGGGDTAPADAAADGLGQALTDLLDGNWSNLFSDVF